VPDYYPDNPREMTDANISEIVTWRHDRHGIGDRAPNAAELTAYEFSGWSGLVKHLTRRGAVYVAPISGIDHSGIAVWIASAPNETAISDSAGWDSGQWGFVAVFHDRYAELMGTADDPTAPNAEPVPVRLGWSRIPVTVTRAEALARAEFAEYAAFLAGEVVAYAIDRRVTWERAPEYCAPGSTETTCTGHGWANPVTRETWEPVGGCSGYIVPDGELGYVRAEANAELATIASGHGAEPIAAGGSR
jgi:hypothetical protein